MTSYSRKLSNTLKWHSGRVGLPVASFIRKIKPGKEIRKIAMYNLLHWLRGKDGSMKNYVQLAFYLAMLVVRAASGADF